MLTVLVIITSEWISLSLPATLPRHSCLCLNRVIQKAWVIQEWKRRRVPTSYSFPLKFLAATNLEPWLSQETEISSRGSLISDKILCDGRNITKSLIIHRTRSGSKKSGLLLFLLFPFCTPVMPVNTCLRERTMVCKMPLFIAGDLAAISFGYSYTLPVSFPCGLLNFGMCIH